MPIFKKGADFNGNKATGLANGVASTDAATVGQLGGGSSDVVAISGKKQIGILQPGPSALAAFGILSASGTGTITNSNVSSGAGVYTSRYRTTYEATTPATNAVAGFLLSSGLVRGSVANAGGFKTTCRFGLTLGQTVPSNRCFVGLYNPSTAPTDVNPSTLVNMLGVGWDSADTNIQVFTNDASGTATKIDTGIVRPSTNATALYNVTITCPSNTSSVTVTLVDEIGGTSFSTTQTTDLPNNALAYNIRGYVSAGGTSTSVGMAHFGTYAELG